VAAPTPRNTRRVIEVTHDAIVLRMPRMFADAIQVSGAEVSNSILTLAQAFEKLKVPKARVAQVNVGIAEAAHAAVVGGWYSRLPRKTWLGGEKHLSGYLGRALADPNNTTATTDRTISFINTELLDREAPHWYRVNYGAAGSRYGQGRMAKRFVIELNRSAIMSFTDDLRPDPVSWIPERRLFDSDGNMFPLSKEVERSSFGARAAHFFDLGHAVVAKEFGRRHEAMWADYVREIGADGLARLKKQDINVTANFQVERNSWSYRVRSTP
jgi:hypothetical protein